MSKRDKPASPASSDRKTCWCQSCERKFNNLSDLCAHMKLQCHSKAVHICRLKACDKRFGSRELAQKHEEWFEMSDLGRHKVESIALGYGRKAYGCRSCGQCILASSKDGIVSPQDLVKHFRSSRQGSCNGQGSRNNQIRGLLRQPSISAWVEELGPWDIDQLQWDRGHDGDKYYCSRIVRRLEFGPRESIRFDCGILNTRLKGWLSSLLEYGRDRDSDGLEAGEPPQANKTNPISTEATHPTWTFAIQAAFSNTSVAGPSGTSSGSFRTDSPEVLDKVITGDLFNFEGNNPGTPPTGSRDYASAQRTSDDPLCLD